MAREFETQLELLEFVDAEGIGLTHGQGYQWVRKKLLPAIKEISDQGPEHRGLVAGCYYVLGDVHDFNHAPLAAIEAYQQALLFDPTEAAAYRELARMHLSMGNRGDALTLVQKALELDPDERNALNDLEETREAIDDPYFVALYEAGDSVWEAREQLAKFNPDKALEIIGSREGMEAERVRLDAYGAMKRHEQYLSGWKRIADESKFIEFELSDWFFMDTEVFMKPGLWTSLLDSKAEFSGFFTVFEGLEDSEKYSQLSCHESIRMRLEYYVYAQSQDRGGLWGMLKDYPEFEELKETIGNW